VSRETFYENFANKEECFLAAYDAAAAIVLDALTNAFGGARREADDRLDRVIEEYLAALTREPRFARTFLVEVYAAGPAALIRRATVQRRFVEAIIGLVGAGNDEQRFACEAIVAATSALVTQRICAQASADLGDLHGPLSRYARASLAAAGIAL
jgi:AcrR family transcriptional regulator